MKYLDYSKLPAFLSKNFPDCGDHSRVGRLRQYVSDYIDIVRFFGPDRIDPGRVAVNYLATPFEISDGNIGLAATNAAEAMRAEGRLRDGPQSMKLVASDLAGSTPSITVQPTDYALQAGTCLAMDMLHQHLKQYGGSLRNYYRHDGAEPTVPNNPLAICLGVSGSLIIDEGGDRYLLNIERSSRLASLGGTIGASVAGGIDYATDASNLAELIDAALGAEIEEELNLRRGEYAIEPLAWAIEPFRGERPQLFCLIRTLLDRKELTARLESIRDEQREYASFEFVPLYAGLFPEQSVLDAMNFEAKMNFYLAEEFLSL